MCYYNGQKVSRAEFIELKRIEKAVRDYDFLDEGVISGFANKPVAVLIPSSDETNFDIVQMEWGIISPYIPNRQEAEIFKRKFTTLNAKAENLFTNEAGKRSMWAGAVKKGRCLVLSTGFFEWRHIYRNHAKTGQPLKTPDKFPYYITVKDAPYFFFAGIYQPWTDRETGEVVNTVAVITTKANPLMEVVHNSKMRMPTILNDDLAWEWMMGDLSDERIMEIASTQYDAKKMDACTIAPQFQAQVDPTEKYEYADLPGLELNF
ncbi:SOS response-associated peptidase [soil metagenome]|jgi:putative SOS response-associated peptidase YedK